jgi:hypothetical protein
VQVGIDVLKWPALLILRGNDWGNRFVPTYKQRLHFICNTKVPMYQIALFHVTKNCNTRIYIESVMTIQRKWNLCET